MDTYIPKFREAYEAIHGSVPTAIVTDSTANGAGLSHDDYPKWDHNARAYQCLCYQCNELFYAKRRDAKYCKTNCRKAASRRKDQIERARRNIEDQIAFIRRMTEQFPELDIFASLELDKIRKLLNVPTAVVTDTRISKAVTPVVDTDNHSSIRDNRREDR